MQFSNGCRQDLDAFGAIKAGRHFVVCASQSLGAFPVDVRRSGIDALASAGHKWLCAGYGAGFCYVSRALVAARPPRAVGWLSGENPYAFDNRQPAPAGVQRAQRARLPAVRPDLRARARRSSIWPGSASSAIAERVLTSTVYLTTRLSRARRSRCSRPAASTARDRRSWAWPSPRGPRAFLRERGVHVTEKPEGVRISTHFYNDEAEVDTCVDALVAYRDQFLRVKRLPFASQAC